MNKVMPEYNRATAAEVVRTQSVPAVRQEAEAPVSIGLSNSASYALAKKVAMDLAASSLVPRDFQNNPPNCLIALNMATRIGADPLMTMQNLYIVHGRPAWSAQFMIATFNQAPGFSKLRYKFKGEEGSDDWKCRAYAEETATGEVLRGAWVSIGLAKKEGWYGKNGSKWQTMPQQMLMYRAASWFIRAYAPEIAMGIHTKDEIQDTYDMERTDSGTYTAAVPAADLNAKLDAEPMPDAPPPPRTANAEPAPEQQAEETEPPKKNNRPTKEEMQARRDDAEAYWIETTGHSLKDLQNLLGLHKDQWSTAHCERIHREADKRAEENKAAPQQQTQDAPAPDGEAPAASVQLDVIRRYAQGNELDARELVLNYIGRPVNQLTELTAAEAERLIEEAGIEY